MCSRISPPRRRLRPSDQPSAQGTRGGDGGGGDGGDRRGSRARGGRRRRPEAEGAARAPGRLLDGARDASNSAATKGLRLSEAATPAIDDALPRAAAAREDARCCATRRSRPIRRAADRRLHVAPRALIQRAVRPPCAEEASVRSRLIARTAAATLPEQWAQARPSPPQIRSARGRRPPPLAPQQVRAPAAVRALADHTPSGDLWLRRARRPAAARR